MDERYILKDIKLKSGKHSVVNRVFSDFYKESDYCELRGRIEPGFTVEILAHFIKKSKVPYAKSAVTSVIESVDKSANKLTITTQNNIYEFEPIQEKKGHQK